MRRRGRQVEENTIRACRKAASDALQVAAISTPVLTGFARGNWNASVGRPDFTTRNPVIAADVAGANFAQVITASTVKINSWAVTDGSPMFIANGTPYIVELEDGYSPKGRDMAKKAVLAAENGLVNVRLFRSG